MCVCVCVCVFVRVSVLIIVTFTCLFGMWSCKQQPSERAEAAAETDLRTKDCILVNFFTDSLYDESLGQQILRTSGSTAATATQAYFNQCKN